MIVSRRRKTRLDSGGHKGKPPSQAMLYGRIISHNVGIPPDLTSRNRPEQVQGEFADSPARDGTGIIWGENRKIMRKNIAYSLFVNYEYSYDGQVPRCGCAP
jgi:hypothetical protein